MRASLNLIKKFVDLEGLTAEEIADRLTFSGLEVEEISRVAEASHLVIGEILECFDHPSSDHLHVLSVDLGEKYGTEQIVCGAPNARKGLKVIVARVGAVLKKAGVTIAKSTIRGVESNGMCCSLSELGVDKSYLTPAQLEGIEELPSDAPIGEENVLGYLGLDDVILDINVLANRSDCFAVFSLAKELGALFHRAVRIPEPVLYPEEESDLQISSLCEGCPQFSLKLVGGVKTAPSPKWLSGYLMAHGIRSINNIVDIGNYVMILTGQPIHMYDRDKLESRTFSVSDAYAGEFIALDDKIYSVSHGDLTVMNGDRAACLAGVMGGKFCAVDDHTRNIIVESANFNGSSVRRTTVRTGLSSDSSARFIKGINPLQDRFVLNLAAQLLTELAGAEKVYRTVRKSSVSEDPVSIRCSLSYINRRLGETFTSAEIFDVLECLGLTIEKTDEDRFTAIVPSHRIDLRCDADLSEEVFRFIGLKRIRPKLPEMVTTVGELSFSQRKKKEIREHLIARGFNEILTYTLISPEMDHKFVLLNEDAPIRIMNPMTMDHSIVRRGLISSALEVLNYNLSHRNKNLALFEISDVTTADRRYEELCLIMNGKRAVQGSLALRECDFYDLSGIFASLMQLLGIDAKRYRVLRLDDSEYFHPGRSAKIMIGKEIAGIMGEIHPKYASELGSTYVLELNLSLFLQMKCSPTKMQAISKFPSVERDYAFVVKKETACEEFIRTIKKEARGIISSVEVFDIYEGEFLPAGFKSLAVKITYSSLEKTLKDSEINPVESALIAQVGKQFGAYLRA